MTEIKYQYLDSLNDKNTLSLVRNSHTGDILTARTVRDEQVAPYQKMLGIHIPHVPYVYDVVRDSQHEYVVYAEYIEGKTLKDYLEENGRCTAVKTVGYAAQLCDALSALQLLGIVHRDIKPENIIISNDGEVYLIDFDISRMKKADSKRDTSVLGTAGYAAPEQFGFAQSDHRTDLYSLGVLINVMSTGCFPGEKMAAGKIGAIVQKCIQMDPDDRYENADELKKDLCNQTDIKNWKDFLHAIPGYRTGNIYVEVLATLGYLFTGFVLSILIEVGMKSFQNAFVVVLLLINVAFWYIFGFDCFGFRTKCGYVERYRDNGLKYFFSVLFFMVSFTIMTFLAAMIIIGLFFV